VLFTVELAHIRCRSIGACPVRGIGDCNVSRDEITVANYHTVMYIIDFHLAVDCSVEQRYGFHDDSFSYLSEFSVLGINLANSTGYKIY
jgi:hypothetical protein